MNRQFRPRRTIDLEFSSTRRAWVAQEPAATGLPRRSRSILLLPFALLLLAGGTLIAGASTLITFGNDGWTRPPSSWAPAAAHTPAALRDAVAAGLEAGLSLYPCRAPFAGGIQLGRFRMDFDGCHIGYGGKEAEVAPFEILRAVWSEGGEGPGHDPLQVGSSVDIAPGPLAAEPVFSCRATFEGGTHPGSVRPRDKGCAFGFGGHVIVSENYGVLQAAPWMSWTRATPGSLPVDAVTGGEEGSEPFYVCRAAAAQGLFAGKVKKSSPGCSIPFAGAELVQAKFEVLVPRWQMGAPGAVPLAALASGRETSNLLYLCRTTKGGTLQLGKVDDALAGCHVGMQDSEVVVPSYEVMAQ